jgi:membrane-bound serine protease (ClpP class)
VLLAAAFGAFAVDVQTGVPRFWSAVGAITLTAGTFLLYDGHDLSWLTQLIGIVLTVLLMVSGIPSLVRTRYSTTTLGREWMVGEMATAVTAVEPEGVVDVRGGRWKATTNRLTPIAAGDRVRVVAIEGVVLEVEPETGGAVDYREMRRSRVIRAESGDAPSE